MNIAWNTPSPARHPDLEIVETGKPDGPGGLPDPEDLPRHILHIAALRGLGYPLRTIAVPFAGVGYKPLDVGLGQVGVQADAVGVVVVDHGLVDAEGNDPGQFGFVEARDPGIVISPVFGRSALLTLLGWFDAREGLLRAIAGPLRLAV